MGLELYGPHAALSRVGGVGGVPKRGKAKAMEWGHQEGRREIRQFIEGRGESRGSLQVGREGT